MAVIVTVTYREFLTFSSTSTNSIIYFTYFTHLGLIPQTLSHSFRTLLLSSLTRSPLLLALFLVISITTLMTLLKFWPLHSLHSFPPMFPLLSYLRHPLLTQAHNRLIPPTFHSPSLFSCPLFCPYPTEITQPIIYHSYQLFPLLSPPRKPYPWLNPTLSTIHYQ